MADDLKVRTEAPEAEPDFMIKFMVADSGNDAGYTLSDHSSYSSSGNTHFRSTEQTKDQDRVKDDVGHGADAYGHHADGGEALRGDEGVHAQGDLYEDGADRVDGNVFHGIADGVLAGAEQIEERLAKDQHDGGQDDRYDDERGKAVAHDLLSAFVVFAAHADAGAGRAAHAQQIANAEMIMMRGKHTPTPVSAAEPISGMCRCTCGRPCCTGH